MRPPERGGGPLLIAPVEDARGFRRSEVIPQYAGLSLGRAERAGGHERRQIGPLDPPKMYRARPHARAAAAATSAAAAATAAATVALATHFAARAIGAAREGYVLEGRSRWRGQSRRRARNPWRWALGYAELTRFEHLRGRTGRCCGRRRSDSISCRPVRSYAPSQNLPCFLRSEVTAAVRARCGVESLPVEPVESPGLGDKRFRGIQLHRATRRPKYRLHGGHIADHPMVEVVDQRPRVRKGPSRGRCGCRVELPAGEPAVLDGFGGVDLMVKARVTKSVGRPTDAASAETASTTPAPPWPGR